MALPGGFLDELRARVPLATLIGRHHKLERSGRQWKTCCPFHGEKTASFYIYDDHYHCFGCGAHGDAITFVMQSEGAGFMEAVERLAAEAGLEVPKLSPAVAEAERRRHTLLGGLETAAALFQRKLFMPEGRKALEYLTGRGLTEETIRSFGLGWCGEGRGALLAGLGREGISQELLIETGLMRHDPETGRSYELFFNRVMFPIRDRRGTVISFGGRVLGDTQPKYLNGPETGVFAKRRSLYGLDRARELRGKAEIVVVEGYMDVIALHQAGFPGAVAPLGTALTEDQLGELWRLSPSPLLCFDGDAAGRRAAARAAELALPLLSPERSISFITLPESEDPDTLVRARGAEAFRTLVGGRRSLSESLYDLLRDAIGDKTPEQRALLRNRLEQAAAKISDRALAREYRSALLDRFFGERRTRGTAPAGRPTARPVPTGDGAAGERARILVAALIRHPEILRDVEHAFCELELPPLLRRIREALLAWVEAATVLDSPGLMTHLTSSGLAAEAEQVLATVPVPLPEFASAEAMPGDAEAGWWHFFGLMHHARLAEEVAAATKQFALRGDKDSQRRLLALRAALIAVETGEPVGT
jgi:DNA primase